MKVLFKHKAPCILFNFPDSARLYQYLDPSIYQMPKVWLPILSVVILLLFVWLRDHFLQEAFLELPFSSAAPVSTTLGLWCTLHSPCLLFILLYQTKNALKTLCAIYFWIPKVRHTGSANYMLIKWMDNPVTHIMADNLKKYSNIWIWMGVKLYTQEEKKI